MKFACDIRSFIAQIPKTIASIEDGKQLIRASGSIGANYIEANEALSKKDFLLRLKIARKEAKESRYWLNLITIGGQESEQTHRALIKEAEELQNILSAIITKST